jgi:hypothetical protein
MFVCYNNEKLARNMRVCYIKMKKKTFYSVAFSFVDIFIDVLVLSVICVLKLFRYILIPKLVGFFIRIILRITKFTKTYAIVKKIKQKLFTRRSK